MALLLTSLYSRVDLHPTSSDNEEFEEDEVEAFTGPADSSSRSNAPTETAHRNRRSRILSTLNAGRMRHATADERIEALRRLRDENEATTENVDQGTSNVGTMNRARARLSRAFGSRPASGVPASRPTSQLPPAAEAPTTAEIPATAEVRTVAAIETVTPFAGALASSPR